MSKKREHISLSALVVAHNEEERLAACLQRLKFVDDLVVVLDKCTDGSKKIAEQYADQIIEGAWEVEGERRNTGLKACRGDWILEIDADEHVPEALANEIREVIQLSPHAWHRIPVDNYIGQTLVRNGWGAYFGVRSAIRLCRKGVKTWGLQRIHPQLDLTGAEGPRLTTPIDHYVDKNISDMLARLDRYTTANAADLREKGNVGTLGKNVRRLFSRFYKCYVRRQGYKEGAYGFLIALCAGLYPLLSHLKARLER